MVGWTAKRPAARRSRSNEGDAPNPVPLVPLRFEHEHEDEPLVAASPRCAFVVDSFSDLEFGVWGSPFNVLCLPFAGSSGSKSPGAHHQPDAKLNIHSKLRVLCASAVNVPFETPAAILARARVSAVAPDFAFAKDGVLPRGLPRGRRRTGANDASSNVFLRQPARRVVPA
jgi:hypothetical protein